jgi:hypothetical protein
MYGNNSQLNEDKSRKRHQLQNDMIMKDSDLKKKQGQKEALEMEIRKLKREQDRLAIGVQQKEEGLRKLDFEIIQLNNEVKKLKKEMNLL